MNVFKTLVIGIISFATFEAEAHDFEVLFPYSLGYDALKFENNFDVSSDLRAMLIDGKIESLGTRTTTFDRSLVTHFRVLSNIPLAPKIAVRAAISASTTLHKQEGKEEPRTIREELWTDVKPRVEVTFFTENNLEVFLGLNYRLIFPYEAEINSLDSKNTEKIGSATMKYPHLGFVKRAGSFQGGFFFQQGNEKSRTVEKYNNRDDTTLLQEERIHDPTTLAIFAKLGLGKSKLFAEFAAIQAGEGGNKTDAGATVEEDYIRLFFDLEFPPFFNPVIFNAAFIYKTLSYADNTNVSLSSIPQFGLHLDGKVPIGKFTAKAGLILGYGKDAQSIEEFNANYSLFTVGATLGIIMTL